MSPGLMNAPSTSYRCRSDPQMLVLVTLMIASVGSLITGSGTVSTDTFRRPCHGPLSSESSSTSSLNEGVPNQQVAKPVPNSSYPRTGTHQNERMGDRPTVLESRVYGVSGTSITVGNTRRCAVCSTTGLTHAVRLTNRQG